MPANIKEIRKQLLEKKGIKELSFLIGNGVNRYAYHVDGGDDLFETRWDRLLLSTWNNESTDWLEDVPQGLSFTELFDVMILKSNKSEKEIKDKIIDQIKKWSITPKHKEISKNLKTWNCPVITTNFDNLLEDGLQRFIMKKGGNHARNASYPWDRYFAASPLDNSLSGFGIWHIHGFVDFQQSVKLGLTEYTGMSQMARSMLHGNDGIDNFNAKQRAYWKGYCTCLHILFNTNICVFGLSLDSQETFLRWLLIERMKYFQLHGKTGPNGWFIYVNDEDMNPGKETFLKIVGLRPIKVESYDSIYMDLIKDFSETIL